MQTDENFWQHKEKQSLAQYITAKEANDDRGDHAMPSLNPSVFNGLQ